MVYLFMQKKMMNCTEWNYINFNISTFKNVYEICCKLWALDYFCAVLVFNI